jgi:hypothetical protein
LSTQRRKSECKAKVEGRNLTSMQRGELALKKKAILAARAKENQRQHGGTAPGRSKNTFLTNEKSEPIHTNKTLAKEAKTAGTSCDTGQKSRDEQSASSKMSWPDPIYW